MNKLTNAIHRGMKSLILVGFCLCAGIACAEEWNLPAGTMKKIYGSWNAITLDTFITGAGGIEVCDGAALIFNANGMWENDYSGGTVVDLGGHLWARQWNVTGTPFGSGPITLCCDGTKTCKMTVGMLDITQKVTTMGSSSLDYPAFDLSYSGARFHELELGGDLYVDTSYLDTKDSYYLSLAMTFLEPVDATGHTVGFSSHGYCNFEKALTCDELYGYYKAPTTVESTNESTKNGRLGGIQLSAAGNSIGMIRLDSQFLKCAANGAVNGAVLRFEGQHPCCGPTGHENKKTGYFDLNAKDNTAYSQTVKWIESDERACSATAGYVVQNTSTTRGTLVISGEAEKTATAYVALEGGVNLTLDAPATFRQVFRDRASTMTGAIAVNGGTLEIAGEATFAQASSLTVAAGAQAVVSSTADDPLGASAVDLVLVTGSMLVLPEGKLLRVKSVTLDGVMLPASEYTSEDLPISGGTVESAQGQAIETESITWTAGDTTDATDALRPANWGRDEALQFSLYKYIPTFAAAGDRAVFATGKSRFAGLHFTRAGGFAVDGAEGSSLMLKGEVTAAEAAAPCAYAVIPPMRVVGEDTVTVGGNADVRFVGGLTTTAKLTKAGEGDLTLAGASELGGDVQLDKGRLMLAGTVSGSDATIRFQPKDTQAVVAFSNATVDAAVRMSGGTAGYNVQLAAGTTNTLNGFFTQSGSLSISGGAPAQGSSVIYFRGGGYVVNKLYACDRAICHVCDVPWSAQYGGFLSDSAYSGWSFDVAGNTIGASGGLLRLSNASACLDFTVDDAFVPSVSNDWEMCTGTANLHATRQAVKHLHSGKNSAGKFWSEGVVTGEAGSLVRLTGPHTDETYTTFIGKLTGGLSLEFAPSTADGCLTLEAVNNPRTDGVCAFETSGSLKVVRGELVIRDSAFPSCSDVTLEGGKLTVNAVNAFNKKETVLYVKDGVINTSARQAFAAAYVWDEEKSDYVPVPSGIYRAGDAGLGGHVEGAGEVRIGKLGLALTVR